MSTSNLTNIVNEDLAKRNNVPCIHRKRVKKKKPKRNKQTNMTDYVANLFLTNKQQ